MERMTSKKSTIGLLFVMMLFSLIFSTGVFAADVQVGDDTTIGNIVETDAAIATPTTTTAVGVEYRGHVQDYGDYPTNGTWVQGDGQLGTTGESKRIEGFNIELTGGTAIPAGASIRYNVHIENEGWQNDPDNLTDTANWKANGEFAGSRAKSQRVEAIEIVLVGADGKPLPGYSVQYLVHGENYGWTQGWKADGAIAGTTHLCLRLEAIQIKIVKDAATAYNTAGTYGPQTGTEDVKNDVTVGADGVTLQNFHIKGDLIIAKEVGAGTVNLNNVTVDGNTYVRGGGPNSIHINGGSYNNIVVEKTASGNVRIVATDATGLAVVISEDTQGQDIILEGAFNSVDIKAPDVNVSTQGDTAIKEMNVAAGATGSEITLDSKTTVAHMVFDEATNVKGQGTIENADVNVNNVTYDKAPVQQKIAPTVTVPPATKNTATITVVPVTGVTVNSENNATTVAVDNSPLQMSTVITPSDATNKRIVWSVTNETGEATISANGLLTGTKAGNVTVTATNPSSGIAASKEIAVISQEYVSADDITIPDPAKTEISGVTITKADGKVNFINQLTVDSNGNVTGAAKTQLDSQTAGIGGDATKGYVGYTVNAPAKGELTKIVAYTRNDGEAVYSVTDVQNNHGSSDAKGDAILYQSIAEKNGSDWKPCLLTGKTQKILWYYADGTIRATYWNVSSVVSGNIARDSANTGGELISTVADNTVNFTAGEIKWYSANSGLGTVAGNRVGVKITAPEGFNPEFSDVAIDNHGYHWSDLAGDQNYFYWYPLVTAENKTFSATVDWSASAIQVFTVNTTGTTLETVPTVPILSTATVGETTLPDNDTHKWAEKYDHSIWQATANNSNSLDLTGTLDTVSDDTKAVGTEESHLLIFSIRPPAGVTPDGKTTLKITGMINDAAVEETSCTGSDFSMGLGKLVVWGIKAGETKLIINVDWDGTGTKYSEGTYTVNLAGLTLNTGSYSGPYLDQASNSFYANGMPVRISAVQEDKYATVITWKGGSVTLPDVYRLAVTDGAANTDGKKYSIFGGAKDGAVDTSSISMNGGTVDTIYGGGYGTSLDKSADVTSFAAMDINGGTVTNCVYGGAKLYGVTNAATVIIGNGVVNSICGGGEASLSNTDPTQSTGTLSGVLDYYKGTTTSAADVTGNYTKSAGIIVTGGTLETAIYGGGQGYGIVDQTSIEIDGGSVNNVCAGGIHGLTKMATVLFNGGTVEGQVYGVNSGYVGELSFNFNNAAIQNFRVGNLYATGSEVDAAEVLGTTTIGGQLPANSYVGGNILGDLNLSDATGTLVGTNPQDTNGTLTIPLVKIWTIGSGATLSIPAGSTLINNGTLKNDGTLTNNGTLTGEVI
ncbi:Ig-like domain-containing protein [Acetobacterium paludosum]|nr:Ig-like domain-containing protein [Acetobacterium paludosum]